MAIVEITKPGFRCERCEHEWIPHNIEVEPTVCPKCKSPYWNKPRKKRNSNKNSGGKK
jgi:Zn finger protein HypA/HybF involved in hydrogenase expression